MDIKNMSNLELAIATIKCIDSCGMSDGCHGCPLENESGCAYELKIEIARRLIGCDLNCGDSDAEQNY